MMFRLFPNQIYVPRKVAVFSFFVSAGLVLQYYHILFRIVLAADNVFCSASLEDSYGKPPEFVLSTGSSLIENRTPEISQVTINADIAQHARLHNKRVLWFEVSSVRNVYPDILNTIYEHCQKCHTNGCLQPSIAADVLNSDRKEDILLTQVYSLCIHYVTTMFELSTRLLSLLPPTMAYFSTPICI